MKDLERLIAIEDLRSLQSRYVRHADLKEWHVLAGLFLPEGRFIAYGMDGAPQITMAGRAEIERTISTTVGAGTALHHLFSYEIDIDSSTKARGIWAMEDWVDRTSVEPESSTPVGTISPFKTMHGYGHYHAAYEKVDGIWFIAELKLFRAKLEFTY